MLASTRGLSGALRCDAHIGMTSPLLCERLDRLDPIFESDRCGANYNERIRANLLPMPWKQRKAIKQLVFTLEFCVPNWTLRS